jgi:hypothetical protein
MKEELEVYKKTHDKLEKIIKEIIIEKNDKERKFKFTNFDSITFDSINMEWQVVLVRQYPRGDYDYDTYYVSENEILNFKS